MTKWHPRRVGFFVLGALALAVVGVVLLGRGRFFRSSRQFVSYFSPGAVNGLRIGSVVRFRGIPVGEVRAMHLTLGGRSDTLITSVPVVYAIDERRIARDVPHFEFSRAFVDTLIGLGLRARLESESFVTGQKYVDLEFRPEEPLHLVRNPTVAYWEIPAVPQPESDLQSEVTGLLHEIAKIDFPELLGQLDSVLRHVNALFGDIQAKRLAEDARRTLVSLARTSDTLAAVASRSSAEIGPTLATLRERAARLDTTLDRMDSTLAAARVALDPESPTLIRLEETMKDLSGAAQSLQSLTDYLERNPAALLRGRPGDVKP